MEFTDYQKYTSQTVVDYPKKWRKQLLISFFNEEIVRIGFQSAIDDASQSVDISELDLDGQLRYCIENKDREISEKCLSIIEKWEFGKDYKYSVIFEVNDFSELLSSLEKNCTPYQEKYADLFGDFQSPQLLNDYNHAVLLKFNRKFKAVHSITGKEMLVRYPVVVAFHRAEEVVEIRFDSLKRAFMEDTGDFYVHMIEDIRHYIEYNFGQYLIPIDLNFLVPMLRNSRQDVILIAESMKMSNGSYAELRVEKNEQYVLPFIGELKNMLLEYASEFDSVPNLKEAFEQFVFKKEVTSDYPWIEILWKNEIKTRSNRVKITFDYYQKGYSLLQYYYNDVLVGMERMDHVTAYICEAWNKSKRE